VAHKAGDHDLMHGEDHAGRSACAAQYESGFDDIGDAGGFAAQFRGPRFQAGAGFRSLESLSRKPAFAVDGGCALCRDGCHGRNVV
jgi:hypothetical protein